MSETAVVWDVRELSTSVLATAALLTEQLIECAPDEETVEKIKARRIEFLDELVRRGVLDSYSFVGES